MILIIKSRANILTRVQSKAYTEPSSFSSLFNLPYSKDIHYFSQARNIAHFTTQCRNSKVIFINRLTEQFRGIHFQRRLYRHCTLQSRNSCLSHVLGIVLHSVSLKRSVGIMLHSVLLKCNAGMQHVVRICNIIILNYFVFVNNINVQIFVPPKLTSKFLLRSIPLHQPTCVGALFFRHSRSL